MLFLTNSAARRVFQLLVLAGTLSLFAFASHRQNLRLCKKIDVRIEQEAKVRFLNDADVMRALGSDTLAPQTGVQIEQLNLKDLEDRIKANHYVHRAQVWKDLAGHLHVDLAQEEPVARVVQLGRDNYVTAEGKIIPATDKFAARVLVLDGPGARNLVFNDLKHNASQASLLALLRHLYADPFWRAMIAEISMDSQGELVFHPQLGKQTIIFGSPENYELKLAKITAFYDKILPSKGWSRYSTVNVKFQNQIVCE